MWIVHREQRSPIWPLLWLNSPYNYSVNQFFVDSNDLKIKLYTCDSVVMIKSTINRHCFPNWACFQFKNFWESNIRMGNFYHGVNWACRVMYGGRTFLRCILDMMNSLISLTAKHKLSAEFHEDIKWWDSFLSLLQWLGPFPLRPAHNWCVDRCLSNSSKGLFLGRLVLS